VLFNALLLFVGIKNINLGVSLEIVLCTINAVHFVLKLTINGCLKRPNREHRAELRKASAGIRALPSDLPSISCDTAKLVTWHLIYACLCIGEGE